MKVRGNVISGIAATLVTAGLAVGGVTVWNGIQQGDAAHARYVAADRVYDAEMAQSATGDAQVAAHGVLTQHVNDVNAEIQAAEAAKAAAALAAQQAAAAAAAQAAAQKAAQEQAAQQAATQQSDTSSSTPSDSGSSGEPAGTPLPMMKVTDPNNAQYGQMVPAVDPGSWCAAHSASTINGVPTCD